jgi:hypothetical protein
MDDGDCAGGGYNRAHGDDQRTDVLFKLLDDVVDYAVEWSDH